MIMDSDLLIDSICSNDEPQKSTEEKIKLNNLGISELDIFSANDKDQKDTDKAESTIQINDDLLSSLNYIDKQKESIEIEEAEVEADTNSQNNGNDINNLASESDHKTLFKLDLSIEPQSSTQLSGSTKELQSSEPNLEVDKMKESVVAPTEKHENHMESIETKIVRPSIQTEVTSTESKEANQDVAESETPNTKVLLNHESEVSEETTKNNGTASNATDAAGKSKSSKFIGTKLLTDAAASVHNLSFSKRSSSKVRGVESKEQNSKISLRPSPLALFLMEMQDKFAKVLDLEVIDAQVIACDNNKSLAINNLELLLLTSTQSEDEKSALQNEKSTPSNTKKHVTIAVNDQVHEMIDTQEETREKSRMHSWASKMKVRSRVNKIIGMGHKSGNNKKMNIKGEDQETSGNSSDKTPYATQDELSVTDNPATA